MRFSLTFKLDKPSFPMEYRRIVISYIKNAISECNKGKYYEKFFKDSNQKDYCFSVVLPKSRFNKDQIELENNELKILFSTADTQKTGLILFSAFLEQKNKVYPLPNDNSMILKSVVNQKQELLSNSRAIFKTSIGSGVCVRDHKREENKDFYYVFDDEKFREKIYQIVKNQVIKAGFSEKEAKEIVINPVQCKKVVVKHYRRYIDISTGIFEIQANSDILQHFYDVGIGSRKSSGFGMLDLVTQDLL